MTLVLFDIDGTLTRGAGAGARALERAIEVVCGWPGACAGVRFHGGTDRGLLRGILRDRGVDGPESLKRIEAIFAAYVEVFPEEVVRTPYQALPGATEIFRALDDERVAYGLVTGNHPAAAEQKLRSAGLWRTFATGAFGSESEDRGALVRLAIDRAARTHGTRATRVFVVGDTENDVRAAHDADARAIAVLTGGATRDVLEAERPHAIFSDLAEAHRAVFWR